MKYFIELGNSGYFLSRLNRNSFAAEGIEPSTIAFTVAAEDALSFSDDERARDVATRLGFALDVQARVVPARSPREIAAGG